MIGRGQCSISAAAEIARNVAPRQCIAMAPSSVLDTGFDIKKYVHTVHMYMCVCVRISVVLGVCACMHRQRSTTMLCLDSMIPVLQNKPINMYIYIYMHCEWIHTRSARLRLPTMQRRTRRPRRPLRLSDPWAQMASAQPIRNGTSTDGSRAYLALDCSLTSSPSISRLPSLSTCLFVNQC